MEGCRDALAACKLVMALLDGTQVDDGTAWEVGYAYALDIPAVRIRTDARYCGEIPGARVNAMIAGSIPICLSREELIDWLKMNMPPEKEKSRIKGLPERCGKTISIYGVIEARD